MRQVNHVKIVAVERELHFAGQAVRMRVDLTPTVSVQAHVPQALMADQIKDPHTTVVPLRDVDRAIVGPDGHAHVDAVGVSARRLEAGRDLRNLRITASDDGYDGK